MKYTYEFNKENCWYKEVCPLVNTCECGSQCIKYKKMDYLANMALLTKKQQHPIKLYVEDIDEQAYERLNEIKMNARTFVENGGNLLIFSKTVGNGKTGWSLKILMNYFNQIWASTDFTCRGLFINVPRFLNELKENIRESSEYIEHIKENILDADLVVWDEVGLKDLTTYEHDYLFSYINARLDNGKSNIFTSNLDTNELEQTLGVRLFSRVVNTSECIELKGSDKRGLNI